MPRENNIQIEGQKIKNNKTRNQGKGWADICKLGKRMG